MKKNIFFCLLFLSGMLQAGNTARIENFTGDVKIRRGLDESWQPAHSSLILETFDTILTGEKSRVKLLLADGGQFILGANAILDIADLRRISKRELFLIITSEKIEKLPQRRGGSGFHINNVNVLHGSKKLDTDADGVNPQLELEWRRNRNGGVDLLEQRFYTNAIIKFHKTLKTYIDVKDCGELYFYLGQAFEGLQNQGQALEAYTSSIKSNVADECTGEAAFLRREKAGKAILRLKR